VKQVGGFPWWLRRLAHPLEAARVLGPRVLPPRLRLGLLGWLGRWRPERDHQALAAVVGEWQAAIEDALPRPLRPAVLWLEPGDGAGPAPQWLAALVAAGWRAVRGRAAEAEDADTAERASQDSPPLEIRLPVGAAPRALDADQLERAFQTVSALRRAERLREAVVVWAGEAWQPLAARLARAHGWRTTSSGAVAAAADPQAALAALAPLVSILVVSHHNPAVTRLCLDSVHAWTEYPRYEVIVVDNGSDADTLRVLAEAQQQRRELRVIANPDNRGFAAACNQAAAEARGEVLCFLNNDTVVAPGWLSVLVAALEGDPGLGLVGPVSNAVANEARVRTGYGSLDEMLTWAEAEVWGHDGRWFGLPMLALFCTAIRRQVWQEVGGLDQAFGLGMFEDDDFSRRLRRAGYRLACRRDSFVHHWQQASFQLLDRDQYLALYERNRRYFREKWGRP